MVDGLKQRDQDGHLYERAQQARAVEHADAVARVQSRDLLLLAHRVLLEFLAERGQLGLEALGDGVAIARAGSEREHDGDEYEPDREHRQQDAQRQRSAGRTRYTRDQSFYCVYERRPAHESSILQARTKVDWRRAHYGHQATPSFKRKEFASISTLLIETLPTSICSNVPVVNLTTVSMASFSIGK